VLTILYHLEPEVLFNKERSLFGVPALGIFKIIFSWA
jgi:hypothetical protein